MTISSVDLSGDTLDRAGAQSTSLAPRTGARPDIDASHLAARVEAFVRDIYDGPTEVHKWSLAKKVHRDWRARQP